MEGREGNKVCEVANANWAQGHGFDTANLLIGTPSLEISSLRLSLSLSFSSPPSQNDTINSVL